MCWRNYKGKATVTDWFFSPYYLPTHLSSFSPNKIVLIINSNQNMSSLGTPGWLILLNIRLDFGQVLFWQNKATVTSFGRSFSFLSYIATGKCCLIVTFGQIRMSYIGRGKESINLGLNNFLYFLPNKIHQQSWRTL